MCILYVNYNSNSAEINDIYTFSEVDEGNAELSDLMEQFREQATKLIDMLDLSIPAVVRLKVCADLLTLYFSYCILITLCNFCNYLLIFLVNCFCT